MLSRSLVVAACVTLAVCCLFCTASSAMAERVDPRTSCDWSANCERLFQAEHKACPGGLCKPREVHVDVDPVRVDVVQIPPVIGAEPAPVAERRSESGFYLLLGAVMIAAAIGTILVQFGARVRKAGN